MTHQIDPWSILSEVWEGEQIAKELFEGRVHDWKVEPVRQVYLHQYGSNFSLLSRFLAC